MTANHSSAERPAGPEVPPPGPQFWLDGDVILCACPDCRAPMSVRFWLLLADCWRCGASIELSAEQETEIRRLLSARSEAIAPAPPPTPGPKPSPAAPPVAPPAAALPPPPVAAPTAFAAHPPGPTSPPPPPRTTPARREPWLGSLFRDTPAWLISMLAHLALLALLALLTLERDAPGGPWITLSAVLDWPASTGAEFQLTADEAAQFDLPLPRRADLSHSPTRQALLAAANDARELRLEEAVSLPEVALVKERIGRADGAEVPLAARDPRLRVEMVTREGGTTLTEAAVARGLRWLSNHQNNDGSWSLAGFHQAADCNCRGDGGFRAKAPGTGLALLPFLGAGQTHLVGKYKGTVGRGLRWLVENQQADGDLRAEATGNEGMYAHGQATIVLCEAFAMTGDEALRGPAQKAVDFVVQAQYDDGGWRYQPRPRSLRGDTSVVGWQLMALQSARAAGLTVPDDVWYDAGRFLDGVQHRDGEQYGYQERSRPTPAMTAEALLCRMYLGWERGHPSLGRGVAWLAEEHPPRTSAPNIYYWYYATQVLHHYGGTEWDTWNLAMRDVLVNSQETRGHAAGSWAPRGEHAGAGGRIYMTALAVCTLEVYYRHLPLFRRIEFVE